ncbi:MAG: sugar phosphate isomerase/epimerase [Candidatus Hydrogenedentes bacterium]|nr:sugar phosphate isomerase/epimerase [Candidatus Hydrogenedentota bacterium]
MFRIGAFTDEISQDLAQACHVCTEFGAQGAEIRRVWNTPCQELTDAQVREIKAVVADHGMAVCSIGSPFGKCDIDNPAEVAQHMDFLRRCSDIALELGCSLVRGFAFWDRDQVAEKPWDAMLEAYGPVPGILEEKGTILGLENEASTFVGTAAHARRFLDMLACDRVKALWDPANHVQDPQGRGVPSYPDGYALLKDDLVHVHVKDAAPAPDGGMPNVFLGMGICHWAAQLQALKDDGYDGYISLETHVNPDRFPDELQAKYGRYLSGEGREGASKVCLAWIRDAVAALA